MIEQNQQPMTETSLLTMTPTAAGKVRDLITQENDPSLALAVGIRSRPQMVVVEMLEAAAAGINTYVSHAQIRLE